MSVSMETGPGEFMGTADYGSVDWRAGLACSLIASALSYYISCKYSDICTNKTGERYQTNFCKALQRRKPQCFLLFFWFLVYAVLEFVALVVLSLAAVVPIMMLIFVWGASYKHLTHLLKAKKFRVSFSSEFLMVSSIIVLTGLAIYFSPKHLYVLFIPKMVVWNGKHIFYTTFFIAAATFFTFLRLNSQAAQSVFRCSCINKVDTRTIVGGVLAGMLGGQAMVLMKLVAEIVENAIFHSEHLVSFHDASIIVIVMLSVLATSAHIYWVHKMLLGVDNVNIRLLIPVHRFTQMISASIGATVYIEEWSHPFPSTRDVVLYSLCVAALLCILLCQAFKALGVQANQQESREGEEEEEEEHVAEMDAPPERKEGLTLWCLGKDEEDNIDDNEEAAYFGDQAKVMFDDSPNDSDFGQGALYDSNSELSITIMSPTSSDAAKLCHDYPPPAKSTFLPKQGPMPFTDKDKSRWVDLGLDAGGWNIRGPTYDEDRVKLPCGEARMKIATMAWLATDEPVHNISSEPGGYLDQHHLNRVDRPFLFVINFLVPKGGNFVIYLYRRPNQEDTGFDQMLNDFINASDDNYRNERFKFIPGISQGPYIARKAVGSKPVLLCRRIDTAYYRGDNHFEVSINCGCSSAAKSIFSVVKGYAPSVTLRFAFLLESKNRSELPERLLTGFEVHSPNPYPATNQ